MENPHWLSNYRLKVLLVRILVNAVVLALVILLVPQIYLVGWSFGTLLILAIFLGVLNAVVKPIMQFLTMPFIFASYGLVVLVVNTLVLYLLGYYFPERIQIGGLLGALLGGLLIGFLSSFLENLFGLARPILPDEQTELRRRIIAEDRGLMQSLMARSRIEKINRLAAIKAASTELPLPASDEPAGEIDDAVLATALSDQPDSAAQANASPAGGEL
jgi:putative membrane protein